MTEMVREHQEGLIVAVDYKGIKETRNGQGNMEETTGRGDRPRCGLLRH
jgi:hypothetical protein